MNKKIVLLAFVLVSSVTSVAKASFDKTEWKYYRNIDPVTESGLTDLILPPDMTWEKTDLSDLRVVDSNGVETPYIYAKDVKTKIQPIETKIINQVVDKKGVTKLVLDLGKSGNVVSRINLIINNPNFRRQVSIYSQDSSTNIESDSWLLVSNKGYIYSFTDPNTNSRQYKTEIDFDSNSSRYYLVSIGSGEEGPLKVEGANYTLEKVTNSPKYSQNIFASISQNEKNKTTEILIDRGQAGLITEFAKLNIKDQNFSRKIVVEASNSTSTRDWVYITSDIISNIKTSLYSGGNTEVSFNGINYRYIKLSIANEDNPKLDIENYVTIGATNSEVVFDAKSDLSYKLYYGNKNATSPRYDISRFSSYIDKEDLPIIGVESEKSNADYVPPKGPVVPFTERNKDMLNIFLVIVVILIAIIVGLYLKKYVKHNNVSDSQEGGFANGAN